MDIGGPDFLFIILLCLIIGFLSAFCVCYTLFRIILRMPLVLSIVVSGILGIFASFYAGIIVLSCILTILDNIHAFQRNHFLTEGNITAGIVQPFAFLMIVATSIALTIRNF